MSSKKFKKRQLMRLARHYARLAQSRGWKRGNRRLVSWEGYKTQIWHGRMQSCAVSVYLIRENQDYLDLGWSPKGIFNGAWGRIKNQVVISNIPEKLIEA